MLRPTRTEMKTHHKNHISHLMKCKDDAFVSLLLSRWQSFLGSLISVVYRTPPDRSLDDSVVMGIATGDGSVLSYKPPGWGMFSLESTIDQVSTNYPLLRAPVFFIQPPFRVSSEHRFYTNQVNNWHFVVIIAISIIYSNSFKRPLCSLVPP